MDYASTTHFILVLRGDSSLVAHMVGPARFAPELLPEGAPSNAPSPLPSLGSLAS
jgi:hypothetical protein